MVADRHRGPKAGQPGVAAAESACFATLGRFTWRAVCVAAVMLACAAPDTSDVPRGTVASDEPTPLSGGKVDDAEPFVLARFADALAAAMAPSERLMDTLATALARDSASFRADSLFLRARAVVAARFDSVGTAMWGDTLMQQWVIQGAGAEDALREVVGRHGMRLTWSEGSAYGTQSIAAFAGRFGRFVSPPLQRYLAVRAAEDAEGFSADAGLSISWTALAQRVVTWEGLLAVTAGSPIAAEAGQWHALYRRTLLTGLDNSPTFSFEDGRLGAQVRAAYAALLARDPSSSIAADVAGYLVVLEKAGWQESADTKEYLAKIGVESMRAVEPPIR